MIQGYLLALCSGSSLGANTNNFTLFNLIENIAVPQDGLGQVLPFELHFYCLVDPPARNTELEMRVVRVDEKGSSDPGGTLSFRTGDANHFRLRTLAFRLPKTYGQHLLRVEWRRRGDDAWNADSMRWPLSIAAFLPAEPPPAAGGAEVP